MKREEFPWLKILSLVLSVAAVATALVFGVVNYLQADSATQQVADSLDRIDGNTQGIWVIARDLNNGLNLSVENITLVTETPEDDGLQVTDLGECRTGLEVRSSQYCSWAGSTRRFIVSDDGAYSPWDTTTDSELNRATIKVDFGPPRDGTTFQAHSNAPGVWRVLVAGTWRDLGECYTGMIVRPGQFCVERQSQQLFLVYATDELVEGDNRPLYPDGYAVLFWWKDGEVPHPDNGRLHDQVVVSGDHFEAVRRSGASWEIVRAN